MSNRILLNFIYTIFFFCLPTVSFCDAPTPVGQNGNVFSSFELGHFMDSLGFQEPASPLMEGLIALHSDIWAIMLFVAGFVLYMMCAILYSFSNSNAEVSYKVHHHSLIEIIWTTIPAIILCIIAVPSFTLLYSLDEIVEPSLTIKAIGRQWYWSAPFYGDLDWKVTLANIICICKRSHSPVMSKLTGKYSTYLILPPGGDASKAERLRGPQHVEEGRLSQRCLGQYASQTKRVKVIKSNASGIHISPREGIKDLVHLYQSNKSSVLIESTRGGLLRPVGPRSSPKTLAEPNHWNSGLAKGRKAYANGGSVVVKYFSEGSQSRTMDQPDVDQKRYTSEEAITQPVSVTTEHVLPLLITQEREERNKIEIGKYSTLFLPIIYKIAYDQIKSKQGNTTPASLKDKQTLDGMGLTWIEKVIGEMKSRNFQFKPALGPYIPKPKGKLRPLGIPTPKDKVVQQAIKLIIEPLFEPHFLNSSHGFRPNRSAHSALKEIKSWTGITWMIEGHMKGCFDKVNHHKLEQLLKRQIKDQNLMSLYWKAVNAGYINNGSLEPHSLIGVSQGGVLSPLLSNVYMHSLDVFLETLKNKCYKFGNRRGTIQNPEYTKKLKELKRLRAKGDGKAIRKAEIERRRIPSVIRTGTRIYYVRYADDWVIGIKGPKSMAENVKLEVETFLQRELKLELSQEKTTVTHLASKSAFFLGTTIRRHSQSYSQGLIRKIGKKSTKGSNVRILLECPINRIIKRLEDQGYVHKADGKPKPMTKWIYMKPEEIILRYNAVIRGYLNYYSFANNRNMLQQIVWILRFSAVFTFARKWNISPKQVFHKLGSKLTYQVEQKTPQGVKRKTYALDLGDLRVQPMKFDLIKASNIADPVKLKYFSPDFAKAK
jgi:group II intron reverse transcriptase/maturase